MVEETIDSSTSSIKKGREKSTRYPANSLKECVDFLVMVHDIGGKKEAPFETILSHMNITSTGNKRFKYFISSSELFGLINKTSSGIQPSEMGMLILYPPNGEEQRRTLLIEAFTLPQIYQKLINKYDNTILPGNNILINVFYNNLGIAKNAVKNAVEVFIESAKFAGVLDYQNRLVVSESFEETKDIGAEFPEESTINQKSEIKSNEQSIESDYYKFEIPTTTGKKACIRLPKNSVKEDIDIIINLLRVLSGVK